MNGKGVPRLALLAEKDTAQREALAAALASVSFDVIECASSAAAELIVAKIGAELHVLITDLWLFDKAEGKELVEFASELFPNLRIITLTGQQEERSSRNIHYLRKSCVPREVVQVASA